MLDTYCTRRGKRPGAQAGNWNRGQPCAQRGSAGAGSRGTAGPILLAAKEESPAGRAFQKGADVRQVAGTGGIQRFPPDNRHEALCSSNHVNKRRNRSTARNVLIVTPAGARSDQGSTWRIRSLLALSALSAGRGLSGRGAMGRGGGGAVTCGRPGLTPAGRPGDCDPS